MIVKVFRNVADAVVAAVQAVFHEGQVADRVVDQAFKQHPKWGARDRHFFAAAVYEIVRWRRLLIHAAGTDEPWALLAAHLVRRGTEALPPWPELSAYDVLTLAARLQQANLPVGISESVPDWFASPPAGLTEAAWRAELAAQNTEAPVTLRVNPLKGTVAQAQRQLLAEGIETTLVANLPLALRLPERRPVTRTKAFQEGWVEVQDGGSQRIAPLLRVEPGMRVLDGCAGAGGKALHLAALMRNRGELRALDVFDNRLAELRRRAARAGVSIAQTALADDATRRELVGWADRLLLDVPCTGTGTLRRQPDLKWRLTPDFLGEINQLQRAILRDYPAMLRPGGLLVYATCSLLPQEGEEVVRERLQKGDLELVEEHRSSPVQAAGDDGFYMALLRKAG